MYEVFDYRTGEVLCTARTYEDAYLLVTFYAHADYVRVEN